MVQHVFIEHTSQEFGVWAQAHLGKARLGHRQRQARGVRIGEAMARRAGASIPNLFDRPADVKAAYAFLEHPSTTPDAIQYGHRQMVREAACASTQTCLLIEDGCEVSYTHRRQRLEGLGSIGTGEAGQQGFWMHTTMVVEWEGHEQGEAHPVRLLGIIDQQYGVRPWPSKGKRPNKASKGRKGQERETEVWWRAGERIGAAPAGTRWIRVADRAADIYEMLGGCQALGHGFAIRASYNRCLVDASHEGEKLLDRARAAPSLGSFEIELRARPKQRARRARVEVSVIEAVIRAPQRPGGAAGKLAPITCSVVRVWEAQAPDGVDGLEWLLLCDGKIEGFEAACERAAQYATRWLIEEFHKAVKTGMGAERLQLDTAQGLQAAVAMMSIVALRMVELRERVRVAADEPAIESGLSQLDLDVLSARLTRPLVTVRDVALAIGRLGGHMNRKGDGMPGWQTLWRGMRELTTLVEGVRLGQNLAQLGKSLSG